MSRRVGKSARSRIRARTRTAARALGVGRKLTSGQRACASEFIAEEARTGKYGRAQAIAIGLNRARRECK